MSTGKVLDSYTQTHCCVLVLDPQGLVLVYRDRLVSIRVVLGACGDFDAVFAGAVVRVVIPHYVAVAMAVLIVAVLYQIVVYKSILTRRHHNQWLI